MNQPALPPALLRARDLGAPLDPKKLEVAAVAAVQAFLAKGESQNTVINYRAAVRYWMGWFLARYGQEFSVPVHEATVIQFIVDHAEHGTSARSHQLPVAVDAALVDAGIKGKPGPMALNTLKHRIAALARLHRERELESPIDAASVRRLLASVRASYAKDGALAQKKDALGADLLQQLLATCDESPQGVRDRALLSFGFATGGRRRSEITAATFAQLKPAGEGYTFVMGRSKTNQSGAEQAGNHKPVVGQAADALRAWLALLAARGVDPKGAIFRRVRRGGAIGEALDAPAVRLIVQKRCALAGVTGDFSAHSLRSGFMTEAGAKGVALATAMAFSGHRDVKTALGYVQHGEMQRSSAASAPRVITSRIQSAPSAGRE